jgi:hypothetical protein
MLLECQIALVVFFIFYLKISHLKSIEISNVDEMKISAALTNSSHKYLKISIIQKWDKYYTPHLSLFLNSFFNLKILFEIKK